MRVKLVWAGGLVLAALLYLSGPEQVARLGVMLVDQVPREAARVVDRLTVRSSDVVRSLALALLGVFVALAVVALRQGQKARVALVLVPAVFLALLYRPLAEGVPASGMRWLGALALAGVAAVMMTRRVR